MLEFFFNLPLAFTGLAIIGSLCLFAVVGMIAQSRCHCCCHLLGIEPDDSEFSGAMLQSVMVFYGLAVALIAVSVFQTYSDVSKVISFESSSLNALYRDVSSYPEATRVKLQQVLREYTDQVIHGAWPLLQQGKIPEAGIEIMGHFQRVLDEFEPATEGQKILHAETLRAYNLLIQARRQRLDAARTGLPGVMWTVIIAGGFISLTSSFFFKVRDARLHGILVTLLATFIKVGHFYDFRTRPALSVGNLV